MDKIQAEQTITSAFNALLEKVKGQDSYTPELLIDDLHQLAQSLKADSKEPLDLYTNKQNFELEYKNLADESLHSYAQTQESVLRINEEQERLISQSQKNNSIKIDDIMHNFANINEQVKEQMEKAHDKISELKKQISILENASNLDPLTRTFNRRALESYIASLCKIDPKASDTRILLIDIDDFKKVNDNYGHLAGDRVLIFLAKMINHSLRDGDKVFRFGGEEFLVVINRANETACQKVAERIMNSVRSNTLLYKEHQIKITLSMGSAVFSKGDTFDSLVDRADKALYSAKNNGKDQLVVG